MKVALVGCTHGALDRIYSDVAAATNGAGVDVILCCGDFQCLRNEFDMHSLACPPKYKHMGDFRDYYEGRKKAPYLTVFIGGNHEASNVLMKLYHGGWVAPNIYYAGSSSVLNIRHGAYCIRIGAISGIFNGGDFQKGYFERLPLTPNTLRSVFHMREFESTKMRLISGPLDFMISHDWPRGVERAGDYAALFRKKPHFREESQNGVLGNPLTKELLDMLDVNIWAAAHMHVRFDVAYKRPDGGVTNFKTFDKPLGRRRYFEIVDYPAKECSIARTGPADIARQNLITIERDLEWTVIAAINEAKIPTNRWGVLAEKPPSLPENLISWWVREQCRVRESSEEISDEMPFTLIPPWREDFRDLRVQHQIHRHVFERVRAVLFSSDGRIPDPWAPIMAYRDCADMPQLPSFPEYNPTTSPMDVRNTTLPRSRPSLEQSLERSLERSLELSVDTWLQRASDEASDTLSREVKLPWDGAGGVEEIDIDV